jgi:hypothetical protein
VTKPTHWVVTVSGGEDAVMGIGQDSGEGSLAGSLWPVEHLGFEPGKLVLQVGEVLGQSLNNARVNVANHVLIRGAQILGS